MMESPKSRFTSIASLLAAASAHSSRDLRTGCVQCGSLIDITDLRTSRFSGKCFRCENWVSDEEEDFEDLED